ncbi:MAG: MOSC N-terminal beta barrel domain-containing protein [Bryobacteraceae bacterium]
MTYYQVKELWRYPVKSMGGEELESVAVTERGLAGDRAYALYDTTRGEVASASKVRKFPDMLFWNARLEADGALRVTAPDDTPRSVEELCAAFGPDVALLAASPAAVQLAFSPGALEKPLPASAGGQPGTLFDYAGIHIVSAATLRALAAAYPEGNFSSERFRPNLVIDSETAVPFAENNWVGRTIAIGPEVRVQITLPCPRCVMATLAHRTLPHDPRILRTAADQNTRFIEGLGDQPCVGAYGEIVRGGNLRLGHSFHVL